MVGEVSKMKPIIFSIIALISFQCKSSFDINGVWLHTTTLTNSGTRNSNNGRKIFDFENDSVVVTSLGDLEIVDLKLNKNLKGSYKNLKNKLLIKTNEGKIRANIVYSSDSLILVIPKFNRNEIILKKLQQSDKCEILKGQFVNKSFRLSILKFSDSIYFLNDTIMLNCGSRDVARPQGKWELTNYKGYNFFHTTDLFLPGMIVSSYTDSTITLNTYINSNINLKLTNISSPSKDNLLIGSWTEIEREFANDVPNANSEFPDFGKLKIDIDEDKVKITQYNRSQIMKWKTTPDFSRIYFLTDNRPFIKSWKIIEISESTLKLRITDETGLEDYFVIMSKK